MGSQFARFAESIPTGDAIGVEIWPLTQSHSPIPKSLALAIVVKRGSVEHASIVPKGFKELEHGTWNDSRLTNIIRVLPLEADLQVMIFVHQVQEPVQQVPRLDFGHTIDVADVPADGEDTLPSGHWVRAHHRVHGPELAADVLRRAALLVVDLEAG
jgi:hypothetical protein